MEDAGVVCAPAHSYRCIDKEKNIVFAMIQWWSASLKLQNVPANNTCSMPGTGTMGYNTDTWYKRFHLLYTGNGQYSTGTIGRPTLHTTAGGIEGAGIGLCACVLMGTSGVKKSGLKLRGTHLGIHGDVRCDDDGVTSVPPAALHPSHRVQERRCTPVAGVDRRHPLVQVRVSVGGWVSG